MESFATEPPYLTRRDIDAMSTTRHVVSAPHVAGATDGVLHITALGEYRGELRRAIHAMKFHNARWIATRFGRHLGSALFEQSCTERELDVVTHAPTTPRRLRLRGHDQSALIAAAVARTMRIPHVRTLRRLDSRIQTGASRDERRRGPDYVVRGRFVRGRRILVIDDVLTTGTTLRHARAALLRSGALEVHCAVVAYVKAPPLTRVE